MNIFRNLYDRAITRAYRNNEYDSTVLRNYFKNTYDIEVGLYSIGAFDRWRLPPGSRVGRYCSIARSARLLDADHPSQALSTHPFFYLKDLGVVPADRAVLVPPTVGDDVWIAHNATITANCHFIGRGAIIGAGAVVMSDVPPYAIMVGAPARLTRFRFPPDIIALLEASEWWTLDRDELAAASRAAPSFVAAPSRDSAPAFFAAIGRIMPAMAEATASVVPNATIVGQTSCDVLTTLLLAEIPGLDVAGLDSKFADLGIDSFSLITLRVAVERVLAWQIPDRLWGGIASPRDVIGLAGVMAEPITAAAPSASTITADPVVEFKPANEIRRQTLNMPQMALEGLSESWLFKELGDVHWSVLTRGLETASADIADGEGARLYATFTRIRLDSDMPLSAFCENEDIAIDLSASRYGAGMFLGAATLTGPTGQLRANLMTSFSKFGEAGENTSLLKGQPVIPPGCPIIQVDQLPTFAQEYRDRRSAASLPSLFETEYEILPPYDINGVGLLYFAAYPMIADLCAMRHGGRSMVSDYSTTMRDVYYFANAVPDEILVFRLHEWHCDEAGIRYAATLSRRSDDKTMAYILTEKVPVIRKVRGSAAKLASSVSTGVQ